MKNSVREEKDLFKELTSVCTSPGFAHVVAFYCFKDTIIGYGDRLKPEDMKHLYSYERLIRTEISTIIGMMFKKEIDLTLPSPDKMQYLIDKTDSLLKEIHALMMSPILVNFDPSESNHKDFNPFANGPAMREPIFYSAESAYNFQYLEFVSKKYAKDNGWLICNKGFSIEEAKIVIKSINSLQNRKISKNLTNIMKKAPHDMTMLPLFIFTLDEIVDEAKLEKNIIHKVLKAFTPPSGMRNQDFNALNDFNIINAYPIIELCDSRYLIFQQYSLGEALYETPFYWLNGDKDYYNQAMKNRGFFTETFCKEKLEIIFGKNRVFSNVDIIDSKKNKAGEIDVLAVFADRAIILQAKSKRLTIEAKKGNDKVIKDDFKKSIQDSYNQALLCSKLINDRSYKLQDKNSNELDIYRRFREIYIFCVVSDHYPALSFQTRQFLEYEQSEVIMPPFIMDIFLLDVMTEMLQSPLLFLSYINRRTLYFESIMAPDELTILSTHLLSNLWVEDEHTSLLLETDLSADLDAAMLVRREGLPGNDTPEGILTWYKDTLFDKLVQQIEQLENPETIDLGFMLLKLNGDTICEINKAIEVITERTKNDGMHHDVTIAIDTGNTGLTIHCNNDSTFIANSKLKYHCELRKYSRKATTWFGICIDQNNLLLKFGLVLNYEWKWSKDMENSLKNFPRSKEIYYYHSHGKESLDHKIGRNDPCPCGSGKKYKKCCLNKN